MKKPSGYTAAILATAVISLMFALVVSCSSTPGQVEISEVSIADWNATVDETIQDPQRAATLKDLGRQLIEVSEATEQDIAALNRQMIALNENYNATQAEMQELVGEFKKTRNARFVQYRDIIFAMREEVSADEWKHLIK